MTGKQQQLEKFNEIYKGLNEQQRIAVDTIEGPVMVIAGPGTGKTQILSARIGKILIDTDTQPENILCLTYTDAGVVAMRKRLLGFIGPDAYKVNIYTFHAFCNDVIQENLSLFEKTALDPISDLERIDLFKKLIDSFPKNHPLKRYRGDVYFEINNLQNLFSAMKREGWTAAFISNKIDEYIASLPERDEYITKRATKEFKKGDVRTDKIAEEKEKMEKLRAAVNEFDRFQQMMRQNNRYDFDDMINWVLKAFEENKELLARYQEQYLYILVDEYQDTSGTQNRLVELLINYWDKPNVFVVGDDDQSIYRFQGANVENMLAFADNYKNDLLTVVLTNNYRSTQPILDVSKSLIDRNKERLVKQIDGLSKALLSSNEKLNQLIHAPVIKEYETWRHEMIDITLQVEKLLQQDIQPGRIGIIYKENKYGEELAQYFKLRNIPVFSKRSLNILDIPLAQKIILLVRYLAAEHDTPYGGDEMLFELLHFDWFHVPPIEIAKLTMEVADKQFSENKTSIRRLLYEKSNTPPKDLFSQGIHPQLKKVSTIIENLIADVPNITLQVLIERIIREAGVLQTIMQSEEKIWQLQVLTGFFDFVKEETHRRPTMHLQELVSIIELMEKEGLSMPLVQVSGNEKGVNLLTAHGSKGLEFEYVFLVGCNSSFWEKKRKPSGGYTFPDTIFSSSSLTGGGQEGAEELRRLFYVALTRAEKYLQISYSRFKNDGKEVEPSMFIAEIQEQFPDLKAEPAKVSEEDVVAFQTLQFIEAAPEIAKIEEEYISRLLDKFVMNVTALNNYLKCPLEFYFKNLIRIPSPKNEATEFGSSVHYALEQLFKNIRGNNGVFHSREQFISDFEWYMHRHRESFTKEQFARRLEYGQEVLANYYDKYINTWNKIVAVERNIRNVIVNGVPLKGKLDKLEFDGKSVNVVDYKTGDPDKARPKLQSPNEKEPNGGDYWRQAVFYKILVDNYETRQWNVVSTEFDFIEPDKKKNYQKMKVVITPEDITTVKEQIKTVWEKIQLRDFYTGCGKEDCHWCNFVKTNNLAVALHEIVVEEDEEI
ncbi:ATP-dependent helicase [Panacibacter ginsenosidivorans]|uniref:DNA 3'-5' helicase n=1 Tax=Panacibacter ginsenosidivorans TaxID=1813871 RepID=A0A5B8VAV6_9BACT|nr:ATP-dependent DNA helicase [Panacibacter ginsenosidivorans]QEC68600.1 ATP-dependent helicase [Panacibacter ginsenosidivorans]